LNPVENIWQFMRDNWLSNLVFKSYVDILNHCCFAWNRLIDMPWKIMSSLSVVISETWYKAEHGGTVDLVSGFLETVIGREVAPEQRLSFAALVGALQLCE
jgi:hypothetical protein